MVENFQKSELPTLLQFLRVRVAYQPHVHCFRNIKKQDNDYWNNEKGRHSADGFYDDRMSAKKVVLDIMFKVIDI